MIPHMHMSAEIRYPDATPDEAWALLVDPEFRAAVCEATHALDFEVEVKEDNHGGASVTIKRTIPADLPDFIKKVVGEQVDVVQTEEWSPADANGERTAKLVVRIKGQPAEMNGAIRLENVDSGVREVISGELKVSIPFLGKKIEPEIAKGIMAAIEKEQEEGSKRLS